MLLKIGWLCFLFFLIVGSLDCVRIFHGARCIVFASSCFFLIAEDRDDSSGCWDFHAQEGLIDNCYKLDDAVATEDGIVWVGDIYHIEGIIFVLCVLPSPKVTFNSILPRASIFLPPKPISGY